MIQQITVTVDEWVSVDKDISVSTTDFFYEQHDERLCEQQNIA